RDTKLRDKDYPDRLILHKQLIKGAAQLVREIMQDEDEDDPFVSSARYNTIARIVWEQNFNLARKLHHSSRIAQKHLSIGERVTLKDPIVFSVDMENAKNKYFESKFTEFEAKPRKYNSSRFLQLARLSKIWVKIDKKLQLSGVRIGDEVIREEPARSITLGKQWQGTFDPKPFPE
ncbi:MAG: hypothetical protein QGG48_14225, partial [Desulfatiglandales bacterium]|nr:hypothetical protein [Desulfatiglandales bacterium]